LCTAIVTLLADSDSVKSLEETGYVYNILTGKFQRKGLLVRPRQGGRIL
jgi:hypothetical protein